MPAPIAVQLHTVRDQLAKDFEGTIRAIAEMGYVGVETAGNYGKDARWFKGFCDGLGLKISSGHTGFPSGDKRDEILDTFDKLETKNLVVPWLPRERFKNREEIKKLADEMNEANEWMRKRGFTLLYHNHEFEFEHNQDHDIPHIVFREYLDKSILFEIDAYWVYYAKYDPARVADELDERVKLWHIKDGPGVAGPNVPVGKGKVDWKATIPAANVHAEWLIVEFDSSAGDMIADVKTSYDFMIKNKYAKGRK
jgi:sugar phosphate isomerase/epimerase